MLLGSEGDIAMKEQYYHHQHNNNPNLHTRNDIDDGDTCKSHCQEQQKEVWEMTKQELDNEPGAITNNARHENDTLKPYDEEQCLNQQQEIINLSCNDRP